MGLFLEQIIGLKPYLVSEDTFKDPKNNNSIKSHLLQLSMAIKNTKHDPVLIKENFKFSRKVLEDHIHDTERVFRLGKKSYAFWMMNSTLNICMSCHTQSPTASKHLSDLFNRQSFSSDFERAEFLFAVKDFDAANPIYRAIILKYTDSSIRNENLETAVQRQVGYYARVRRDFAEAVTTLKKLHSNYQLPDFIKLNLLAWVDQFSKWQKKLIPDAKTSTSEQIIKFAEKNLRYDEPQSPFVSTDPGLVSDLVVSGVLFEYLNLNPLSPKIPDILYWLAISDRETSNTFFYSMADLYLRECITQYPENPMAIKCYKEHEANTISGYTGSAGTNLPGDVSTDLKKLKRLIEKSGNLKLKKGSP